MDRPIDKYPLRDDPLSGGAVQTMSVGDRKLVAMADGFFRMPKDFLGSDHHPTAAYDALEADYGEVRLPIGCFLLPGEMTTLIDAGFGPHDYSGLGVMVGGRLLERLQEQGVTPGDVDVVALSHLHLDHIGWVADADGQPTFPKATVQVGQGDWDYFVRDGRDPVLAPNIRHALLELADHGQLELLDGETQIVPGLTRMPAPGHTPGHSVFVVHDAHERVLLFGDALYCPHQLTETDWSAASDVDPFMASRTRERFLRDLDEHGGSALGCHFPELIAARVLVRPSAVDPETRRSMR